MTWQASAWQMTTTWDAIYLKERGFKKRVGGCQVRPCLALVLEVEDEAVLLPVDAVDAPRQLVLALACGSAGGAERLSLVARGRARHRAVGGRGEGEFPACEPISVSGHGRRGEGQLPARGPAWRTGRWHHDGCGSARCLKLPGGNVSSARSAEPAPHRTAGKAQSSAEKHPCHPPVPPPPLHHPRTQKDTGHPPMCSNAVTLVWNLDRGKTKCWTENRARGLVGGWRTLVLLRHGVAHLLLEVLDALLDQVPPRRGLLALQPTPERHLVQELCVLELFLGLRFLFTRAFPFRHSRALSTARLSRWTPRWVFDRCFGRPHGVAECVVA